MQREEDDSGYSFAFLFREPEWWGRNLNPNIWHPREAALDYSIPNYLASFIEVQHDEAKRTASPNVIVAGDFYAA